MRPDCKTEKDAPFLVILPFPKWPELELNLHIDALEAVGDDLSTCMVTSGYPPREKVLWNSLGFNLIKAHEVLA